LTPFYERREREGETRKETLNEEDLNKGKNKISSHENVLTNFFPRGMGNK